MSPLKEFNETNILERNEKQDSIYEALKHELPLAMVEDNPRHGDTKVLDDTVDGILQAIAFVLVDLKEADIK